MKHMISLLAMLCFSLLASISAFAMDSDTLLNNPSRYRVLSTQTDGIVYVDMDSLHGLQTMDFPSSLETISCTLYVEKYGSTLDAMTIQRNKTIHQINEYTADFHADKVKGAYTVSTKLTNVYTAQGKPYEVKIDTFQFTRIKDAFINLYRLSSLPRG